MKSSQFFYDMNAPMEDKSRKRKGERGDFKAKRPPPQPTGPCWFCKYFHPLIQTTVEKKDIFQPHFGHFSKVKFLN